MSNRIAIVTLIVAILTMFIGYGQWQYPKQEKVIRDNNTKILKIQELIVSGMNLKVYIKEGARKYRGGELKGMNQESTIYVSKEQFINVKVNGSNIKVVIDKELIDGINIAKSGTNIKVIEL